MCKFVLGILALFFSASLSAKSIQLSHNHTETIEGVSVTFPVRGEMSFRLQGAIVVDLDVIVSMNDLHNKLGVILAKGINRSEECGDRVSLKHARLTSNSDGTATSNIRIEYEKWYCTYMDIPEVHGFNIKMVTR